MDINVSFKPVEIIDGLVEDVNRPSQFYARLTFRSTEEVSIARISFDQIPVRDHKLIEPGATFIWIIGVLQTDRDTKVIRVLQFNDEVWTKAEIEEAEAEAERLQVFFEAPPPDKQDDDGDR